VLEALPAVTGEDFNDVKWMDSRMKDLEEADTEMAMSRIDPEGEKFCTPYTSIRS